jgi:hypothetical protein
VTGFECLQRQHPRIGSIIGVEHAAWQAYVDYMLSKMPFYGRKAHYTVAVDGDAESHRLFRVWRKLRDEREAIGNPRHKRDNIRFSTRGER